MQKFRENFLSNESEMSYLQRIGYLSERHLIRFRMHIFKALFPDNGSFHLCGVDHER